uniref:Protein MIS12 homolog n=1 Tax=Heliothis virescens TaxID=7102 RepID=A0A2A4J174_HELVI
MISTKPWTGGTEEEYETQHFGFGAQRLKIAVRQMVEQKITNGVKDMESYLQESLDLNETDKATLTRSCDKLIRLYCERAGPSLGAIDEEIERMLKIPHNVLLPEDEVQLEQTSDSDYEKLKEEVASLRRRVERGALMEALLSAEEEELASVEKVCETAKKDMEAIDLICKSADNSECLKAVQSETEFLCASASFMKKQSDLFDE